MKKDEGFVLLRSLLSIAVVLLCAAALYASLAAVLRQNTHLEKRLGEELSVRKAAIMERIR